jgi:DNA-binding NtrC family response regulator
MNILFIEDEKELSATGVAQLELKGYSVYPTYDIAESQAVLEDPEVEIDLIITDHRLPDGLGIPFLIAQKELNPKLKCAVVSGCLTDKDIEQLEDVDIPYFRKPLLYSHVVAEVRRYFSLKAPVNPALNAESPASDSQTAKEEPKEAAKEEPKESAKEEAAEKAKPKKKLFGIWPLGKDEEDEKKNKHA